MYFCSNEPQRCIKQRWHSQWIIVRIKQLGGWATLHGESDSENDDESKDGGTVMVMSNLHSEIESGGDDDNDDQTSKQNKSKIG